MLKHIQNDICCFQVIIQSLRESGAFSSLIAKASQESKTKDDFLKSVESSNSSKTITSGMNSRKNGAGSEFQALTRRVLEFIDDSFPSAIPPLSPPGPGTI